MIVWAIFDRLLDMIGLLTVVSFVARFSLWAAAPHRWVAPLPWFLIRQLRKPAAPRAVRL